MLDSLCAFVTQIISLYPNNPPSCDILHQISESANPVHLVISDDDATAVLDLVNKTGLREREPADVRCMVIRCLSRPCVWQRAVRWQ